MKVPRLDPNRADAPHAPEIRAAIERVLASGQFIGGPEVEGLERELAAHLEVREIVSCGSGTDALTLGLLGLRAAKPDIPDGAPVVVPALSFSATASGVLRAGLRPHFVDVDPESLLMDWTAAAAVDDAVAVIPVHLYGRVCARPRGWDVDLPILADACQALGASEPQGDVAATAFSFFPSKPLGCYGDGGALACSGPLAEHVRSIARHGVGPQRYVSVRPGFNSRLDAMQAAILRAKLPGVQSRLIYRAEIAAIYQTRLQDQDWIQLPEFVPGHAWHCYVIRLPVDRRDRFIQYARDRGIDVAVHYPVPLHRMPAFASSFVPSLPHAEDACQKVVSLPIWSGMTQAEINAVVETVRSFHDPSHPGYGDDHQRSIHG